VKLPLVAALITCALLLAGCSSSSSGSSSNNEANKTSDQILSDAQKAAANAQSVHIAGSGTSGTTQYTLDLHLTAGGGGYGHLVLNGAKFDIVHIGDKLYLRGDSTFVKGLGPSASRLANRWFVTDATLTKWAGLAQFTDIGWLTGSILKPPGALSKVASAKINGQQAIGLEDSLNDGTLYIAAAGTPYPLELSTSSNGAPGSIATPGKIVFSSWDQPVRIIAPKGAVTFAGAAG
jgi:hypothetical protein